MLILREICAAGERLELSGRCVLVAVSGGVDSTALACALCELAEALDIHLVIGHVNHGLRGAESDADEEAVGVLARKFGLPFLAARIAPERLRENKSSRARPSRQEAARSARYAALYELAARGGAQRIASAHTADDQAETVLLRLLRGTGPDGLGGIPERSPDGCVVRPLLRVTREAVLAYVRQRGITWREDSSNRNSHYARNRLRHRWLSQLAGDFNPKLLRAITDLAEAQRRDTEWIESEIAREAAQLWLREGKVLRMQREGWKALPEALARRLARRAMQEMGAGREVSRVHLTRMLEFLRSPRTGKVLELPDGLCLVCERGLFRLQRDFVRGEYAC